MRTKVTLVLVFLNVALFFFIFYVRPHFLVPVEGKDRPGRILGAQAANIQSLEIKMENPASTVRLERRGEIWMLTQPLLWPANEFAVKRILNELQFLEQVTSFSVKDLEQNGRTLAYYGLEKPPLTLSFTPGSLSPNAPPPKPVVLKIGEAANVGNLLYLLSPDGERVHVVNRSLLESLAVKLEDLRAETVFTIPVFEARALTIQFGPPTNSKVRLRRDSQTWKFENPLQALANKDNTETLINSLDGLRIKSFVEPRNADPARTSLEPGSLRLALEGNNRIETLLIGAPVEAPAGTLTSKDVEYYAKLDNQTRSAEQSPVFTVTLPTALLTDLRTAQEHLREHRFVNVDPSTVSSITLSAPRETDLTLQRLDAVPGNSVNPANAAWQIVIRDAEQGPKTMPADRELVQNLLEKLALLSVEEFTNDAPREEDLDTYGLRRPARQIQIVLQSTTAAGGESAPAPVSLNLQIGAPGGGNHSVYAKLDNHVYRVSPDILTDTPVSPLAYRERTLHTLPAGAQIVGLKLTDLSTGAVLLNTPLPLPPASDSSSAALPPARRNAIDVIVTQLRTLRVKSFEREGFPKTIVIAGEERPWKYLLEATLSLVGAGGAQAAPYTLFLSERVGGTTQLVGSPELNVVFHAEQSLLDAVFSLTYGPRDPGPTLPTPSPAATTTPLPAPAEPPAAVVTPTPAPAPAKPEVSK